LIYLQSGRSKEITMRTLQIAAVALLAFSSAAYAMSDGPYHHPMHRAHHFHSAMHRPVDSGQPPINGFTAYPAPSVAPAPGWGPGEAWHSFPGSLNANGG
jgi:hypothetical protein